MTFAGASTRPTTGRVGQPVSVAAPPDESVAREARRGIAQRAAEVAPELADLVELYYRHVPAEELLDGNPDDAVAAVRAHRALAENRPPGRPAIRVVNPALTRDGWRCPATVVLVVADDMPFLVDSLVAALSREGLEVCRLVHPIVVVRRSVTGSLREVLTGAGPDSPPPGAIVESWMHFEVDRVDDPDRADQVAQRLSEVLTDVREVAEDADRMAQVARAVADRLDAEPPPFPPEHVHDVARLARWLADGCFTFLGYRRYELVADVESGQPALRAVLASGLGVLRRDSLAVQRLSAGPDETVLTGSSRLVVLTQAGAPSTVYRPVYPYYLRLTTFDADGRVTGEHRFLGVLTVAALHEDVMAIPVLSRRVREVIHRAGFPLGSYSGQRMLEVIQTYPRSELFAVDTDTLYATATAVLALAERRRVRLFLRRDPYGRFFSCVVYLPRDRYTTAARLAMQEVLLAELEGTGVEYAARIGESRLALVHFTVRTGRGADREVDTGRLQERLAEAVRTWDDRLLDVVGPAAGADAARFGGVFPEAYKEDFGPFEALADLRALEELSGQDALGMSFYAPGAEDTGQRGERRFKLYLTGARVTLSAVLPVLHAMGVEVVDERPYEVHRPDGLRCWIYDFGLRLGPDLLARLAEEDPRLLRTRFQDAFAAAWSGAAEVDRFNALVLRAGLDWRQAAVLRAYAKYLRQVGSRYGQDYVEDVMLAHVDVVKALLALFAARFDPDRPEWERAGNVERLAGEIASTIDNVPGLDADRILRSYLALITATTRTNYFVASCPYLALKLDPQAVPGLPAPRPRFEIFVCSPRVEGVHLRFGPVARGGLRWSDRREDYRTEVLGLVKAQAVKNAVIVPVGAKGGFVVKRPPPPTGTGTAERQAMTAEGIACYRAFVSGLLDLIDNLVDGVIRPPERVVRHDGDDAYLVVAADKGTATFSDIANEVAASYGFWLDDAFASGGSAGYDHKAMGITARGTWESVQRHFRELGTDTRTEDFTVVGIGDMSGDVFGNGMLATRHVRLVAAFDHRHVFLDPAPDASRSYAERERLFRLPRSSWDDYDRSLLSEGGGIWPRTAKSVPLSGPARAALGLADDVRALTPGELIRAILLAPADLLWNGGIGTYVKARGESHAHVGDKANDAVRVDGGQLRVKVVGEGGNLGMTQAGRVEYARAGGKVNTDAIDNSAGVDCSDHEVNIKILLDRLVAAGKLDRAGRDALLAEMTDEVAGLVLAHNRAQNDVLGVGRAHAAPMVGVHRRLVAHLAARHGLDRALEQLPDDAGFAALEQAGEGLTAPELASLLGHVKLALSAELLRSDLADAEAFARRLPRYFPRRLTERFGAEIAGHPLRREIVTTMLVNEVVDGGGISFAFRLAEEMTASATDAVRAYAITTATFDLPSLWREIADQDNVLPTATADALVLESRRLLDRASRWFLSNRPQPLAVNAETSRFRGVLAELMPRLPGLLCGGEAEAMAAKAERFVARGAPVALATRVAGLLYGYSLLDVVEVTELAEQGRSAAGEREVAEVTDLYYALSEHLGIDTMLTSVSGLARGDRWYALARLALRDDLYGSLRAITLDVLGHTDPGEDPEEKIAHWEQANSSRLARARSALSEISQLGRLDLATLSVAAHQIRSMVR